MSVDLNKYPREEWDGLAAEFALGVLEGEDAEAAEQLMRDEPVFQSAVWRWRERLASLTDRLEPVTPGDEVWRRIEDALPRPDAPPRATDDLAKIRRKLGFWRGWALAATAVATAIAIFVGVGELGPRPGAQRFVAVLDQPEAGGAGWIATVDLSTNEITLVSLAPTPGAEGRSQELWFISAEGGPPRSLGLLDQSRTLDAPREVRLQNGVFAVSLEPEGGSPTGQPTGPVIYQGTLRPLPD